MPTMHKHGTTSRRQQAQMEGAEIERQQGWMDKWMNIAKQQVANKIKEENTVYMKTSGHKLAKISEH